MGKCERCDVRDGVIHPLGRFEVKIEKITLNSTDHWYCQKCMFKAAFEASKRKETDKETLTDIFKKLFKVFYK